MASIPRLRVAVLAVLLVSAVPVYSHHSFGAIYVESQSITIEGDVVEFQYRAPHAWVHFTARDERGQTQRYSAEWGGPSRLERDGISKETLQYGDQVSVTGAPSRDANSRQMHLKKITRFSRGEWSWNGPQQAR